MFKHTIASGLLFIATAGSASHAAVVTFRGQFESGTGSALGNVPPEDLPFAIMLDFTQTLPGFADINSGNLTSGAASIAITGGEISLTDNGTNDSANFFLETTGPTGTISTNFSADAVSDDQVNTPNLVSIINASAPSFIIANFGGGGVYTGNVISAVPEPNAMLLLLGSSLVALRRRSRKS